MWESVLFAPLVPMPVIWAAVTLTVALAALALWRGLAAWALRTLAAGVIVLGLLNPSVTSQEYTPLPDIALIMVDESASQSLPPRPAQTRAALEGLKAALDRREGTEVRVIAVPTDAQDGGTLMIGALRAALQDIPQDQLAAVFVLGDGQFHDAATRLPLNVPLHLILSGTAQDWDRRLIVKNAPAFGIMGEPLSMTVRIEDQGAAPAATQAPLLVAIDGAAPQRFTLPLNQDIDVDFQLSHGGINVIQLWTPPKAGELTDQNNTSVLRVNGIRDRLRVLLVSGEPHAGQRTWRNLLKSDASVDLVHFTILRPFEKQGNVPISELSLIAFPTRELFLEKINGFDLIIFDRYKRRGLLPRAYFQSIVNYVDRGGAVLIAAGPDFATADSIYRSPLGAILPAAPTARVFEEGILPKVSVAGARHPVTASLNDGKAWGRWLRQVEVKATSGDVLMTGLNDAPLLIVDRVGAGRTALLASDHAWLWDRGFEGGGPQRELLRRLAHWMMKEPELEEDALWAAPSEGGLRFTRRSLDPLEDLSLQLTLPDGGQRTLTLEETAPGQYQATWPTDALGLFRARHGDKEAITALGPATPREFENTIASATPMADTIAATGGGTMRMEDTPPRLRNTRPGRVAAGRGWLGLYPRHAKAVQTTTVTPLLPAWALLLLAGVLTITAWWREGRISAG